MVPLYLPYYEQPHWDIGPLTIHAFGVLVALALVVGTWVARWHGQGKGQSNTVVVDLATWTCISGFVVAHLVSVIFYFPERILEDPLQLVYVWNGLSSFGGFFGAAVGAVVFIKRRRLPVLPYIETLAVGLGPGWVLGRLGCTVAHDHPGRSTDFFLAFDHPTRGPIHDLGFYEFLFAIGITILVFIVRRLKFPAGSIPAMMAIVYSPVRFMFDYLRVSDATYSPVAFAIARSGGLPLDPMPWWYLNLTPGQWFSIALFVLGIVVAIMARRGAAGGAAQGIETAGKTPNEGGDQHDTDESRDEPRPDGGPDDDGEAPSSAGNEPRH